MRVKNRALVAGAAVAIAVLTGTAVANSYSYQAIDPAADHLLRQASDYLGALDGFVVQAEVVEDDWVDAGVLVEFHRSVEMAVRRPNMMWAEERGSNGHRRFWFDGSTLTLMDEVFGTYAQSTLPGDIDDLLTALVDRYDVHVPLADLAVSDLYATVMQGATSSRYVGLVALAGGEYHHLAFSRGAIDFQLWVDAGPGPLPARLVIHYKGIEGSPRFVAELSHWETGSPLPEAQFRFVAPPGATKIEFVTFGADSGR